MLLFGGFLARAVADRISMKRRPAKPDPRAPEGAFNDFIAIVGGLGLYLAFVFWLHAKWIGVSIVG